MTATHALLDGPYLARPGGVGVHIAQVGLLLDFFAGYTAPRHLYSDSAYVQTWEREGR